MAPLLQACLACQVLGLEDLDLAGACLPCHLPVWLLLLLLEGVWVVCLG